jgi:hypothetical protein
MLIETVEVPKYSKIQNVFKRNPDGQLDPRAWANEAFTFLATAQWIVQEKIDGTNVRVVWDGHNISFGGRNHLGTDNFHGLLRTHLEEKFGTSDFECLIEQTFGETPVILFGEGYGHKIQTNGHAYLPDSPPEGEARFIGFDVMVGRRYLPTDEGRAALASLGVPVVKQFEQTRTLPEVIHEMTNALRAAAEKEGNPPAIVHEGTDREIEGYVVRPAYPMFDHRGNRVIGKVILNDIRKILAMVEADIEQAKKDAEAACDMVEIEQLARG